ncbi:putative flavoprotein [Bernardetia litoralis DSM 6794]|uniref:Putative flavoprotein n=1 Tax=Bernardetia litoralis (strain ATCC 23117 / DSM 6794 / NBRC 15988 / NCIMB 1366 / Fx l1 / Sio-4) TaxID=880071 RepID=I4AKB0_BERLS|nr:NADPH-dependent FMN reductase [Bernardetia litoralis]AFM04395.1 putative flavoprotein [Bernardetia litoralis DSM 6794]
MIEKKNIFIVIGSASDNSTNRKLIENFVHLTEDKLNCIIYNDLKALPHFDPKLSSQNPPKEVLEFREKIKNADAILICTPEYIFSIPSGLKNAIEWCISTTVFTDKPLGIITASASGQKAHEELQLIMKTAMAKFTKDTILLIQGIKGKINKEGQIIDSKMTEDLKIFANQFNILLTSVS